MSDHHSDGEFGADIPSTSGINLLKLAHNGQEDNEAPSSTDPAAVLKIFSAESIIPPEIKEETSPSAEAAELDALLEELESGSNVADSGTSLVTSTIGSEPNILNVMTNPVIVSTASLNIQCPAKVTSSQISPRPSQELSVSSSRKENAKNTRSVLPDLSSDEDQNEVTSTTNTAVFPTKKVSNSLASWLRSKQKKHRRKNWKFTCKVCDYVTPIYSTLYAHFKRFHPRVVKSGKLLRYYNKSTGSVTKRKVPILYVCQHCNYVTLSINGYMTHSGRRHPRRKANPLKNGSLVTTAANRKYLETLYKSEHAPIKYRKNVEGLLKTYHKDSKVLPQNQTEETRFRRKVHHKNKAEKTRFRRKLSLTSGDRDDKKCWLCQEKFSSERLLHQHYRTSHAEQGPKKNSTTGLYYCKLCPHDAVSWSALRLHYSRCHFMDAFYAWNVSHLEPQFKKKDKNLQSENKTAKKSSHPSDENVVMETIKDLFSSKITWDEKKSTRCQVADSRVPCVLCEYSSRNMIDVLSHYEEEHAGRYPKGFRSLLHDCLMKHTKCVNVPVSDVHLAYGAQGAWLDENDNIIQAYKYGCVLCTFKCSKFQDMMHHFTCTHPLIKSCAQHIESISSEVEHHNATPVLKCQFCMYTSNNVKNDMELHYKDHHPDMTFDLSQLLNSATLQRYICGMCTFKGSKEEVQWHYAQCHDSSDFSAQNLVLETPDTATLTCFACEFATNREIDLAFHYERQHAKEVLTFTTPLYDDGFQCLICKAITQTQKGMTRHHKKHINIGNKKFGPQHHNNQQTINCLYCKHCRRVFSNTQNLWGHITQQHCPLSQLITVLDLPPHVIKHGYWEEDSSGHDVNENRDNEIQSKPDLFSDTDIFVKKKSLISYTGFSDENESVAHKCLKCYSNFDTKKEYSQHFCNNSLNVDRSKISPKSRERQTRLIEKRVQCKFCPLTTTHHQNLRRHLQAVHRHDVSFRCFKCNEEISNIAECVKHHSTMHGLRIGRPTALNFLLNDIVTCSEGQAKYMCSWCGYKGFSRTFVLNHLNSRHIQGKEKSKEMKKGLRFYCKWCEYYSRSSTSMRGHITIKHNRTVSYQTLRSFQSSDTAMSGDSSDESDDEYLPSTVDQRRQQIPLSPKKSNFTLSEECSFELDSDFSDSEEYRSTHARCKHHIRYPHLCKYCMTAFVCSTKFQVHCSREHSHWCSISSTVKCILILPDPIAIPSFFKKLRDKYDTQCNSSVFYNSKWPCGMCKNSLFENPVLLQEHVREEHNGQKLYICRYCEFTSFIAKKILLHSQQHPNEVRQRKKVRQPIQKNASAAEDMDVDLPVETSPQHQEDSDIDVISDNADSEMPELNDIVLQATFDKIPSTSVTTKARKSTRRYPMHQESTSTLNDEKTEKAPVVFGSLIIDDDMDISGSDGDLVSTEEVNLHFKHSFSHSGLIRCSKCEFYCTDPERMSSHVKATHMSAKKYACKFCDFVSDGFTRLDDHLAEFHKIKRNHQLGLQLKFSAESNTVSNEAALKSISAMKSRFLYTPTPCLPIVREKVEFLPETSDDVCIIETTDDTSAPDEKDPKIVCNSSSVNNEKRNKKVSPDVTSNERFKCSYCGHIAQSSDKLEMHMRRHERNFQQDFDDIDSMSYNMNKIGMVNKFP